MRAPWEDLEPASRERVQRHRDAVKRIESFADTVFALSLVVIVLRGTLPVVDNPLFAATPVSAVVDAIPRIYVHFICVLFLLVYWVLHHYQFRYLTRSSGGLIWLTGLLAGFLALLVVTTSIINTPRTVTTAVIALEANILVVHTLLVLTWSHAVKRGLMFGGDVPSGIVRRMRLALRLGAPYLVATMGLAFIAPYISMNVLAGLGLFYAVLTARGGYTLDMRHRESPGDE